MGVEVDIPLILAGVALHFGADGIRNCAWCRIVRAAFPARGPRRRDIQAAAFAGGGVNALVPARAGDLLKVGMLRRRSPGLSRATGLATLAADSLFESVTGAMLLAWALWHGLSPLGRAHPLLILAGGLAVAALAAIVVRRHPSLAAGFRILRGPWTAVAAVLGWQLAARAVRLGAISCGLAACALPATLTAALAVMAIEGGTRVRLMPLSGGLRLGLLASALPLVTGVPVATGAIAAYLALITCARTVVGAALATALLARELGTLAPRRLASRARVLCRFAS